MCGIAGFIDFNGDVNEATLIKMTDVIKHRGPDAGGYYFAKKNNFNIGLGHRRLSVIDLNESANQPMSKHGLRIVYNGEIYNYKEVRKKLINLGYTFTTKSDTEVIISAFDYWGVNAVNQLIGMFVFVILDENNRKLFIFRDRAGVKPLYLYERNGLFLFASELKSFHEIRTISLEIDTDALADYFRWGYIPTPKCIFQNCYKMRQGTYTILDLQTGVIEEKKYWNIFDFIGKPPLKIDDHEVINETEALLKSAFEYRMVADVPVGVFLSGGYDSSLVTAILQKDRTQKIKTFTIGFENKNYDESKHAYKIAKHIGTEHHEFICTEKESKDIIGLLPDIYDEPFGDDSAIPTYLVSKLAKQQVTVALSADGGDEQFVGYNRYVKAIKLMRRMDNIPDILLKNIGFGLKSISRNNSILKKIGIILYNNNYSDISAIQTLSLLEMSIQKLFIKNPTKMSLSNPYLKEENAIFALEYQMYMQDDILAKIDRAGMAVSLEGREPFLDHRIAEWVIKLPVNVKYQNNTLKFLLKEITHKYIPKEIIQRPKKGFGIPINFWLRNDLSYLLDHYLAENRIKQQNIFRFDYINKEILNFKSLKSDSLFIWHMVVFQMWYDRWMK